MRDGVEPWRTADLVYLEREINYWTGPVGYRACAAGVAQAQAYAAQCGMDRVAVLPAWAARYTGDLTSIVAAIDPQGSVFDCDGAEIVVMPAHDSLARFGTWVRQQVTWTG